MTSLTSVHKALLEKCFTLSRSFPDIQYRGTISFKGKPLPIKLVISDRNLIRLPSIQLLEIPSEIPKVCAHINAHGYLCYLRNDQVHLRRDNLGGSILGCLEVAERLLERLANGDALTDFQDEFSIYWGGAPLLIDIPEEIKEGLMKDITLLEFPSDNKNDSMLIIGQNHTEMAQIYSPWGAKPKFNLYLYMRIVDSDQPLGAMANGWPPTSLQDLKDWLTESRSKAVRGLLEVVKDAYSLKKNILFLLIRASNASCAVMIDFEHARKTLPCRSSASFMRFVFKNSEKRITDANGITKAKSRAAGIKITRLDPVLVDPKSWLTRNLPDTNVGLAGKRIMLLGCGAIGGYLADLLAKNGAGFLNGKLILSDDDTLSVGNIGRHLLGFSDLKRPKTEALRDHLVNHYPRISIDIADNNLLSGSRAKYLDLIIDATGNQSLSLYLSEQRVSGILSAPIVFTWVAGAGCGAQAYLMHNNKNACLHCLDYATPGGSASVMRQEYTFQLKNAAGSCGDWLVPFSASAAIHAAALALDLAAGWANGRPNPLFRSITLDTQNGKTVKPSSPLKHAKCLICSRNH